MALAKIGALETLFDFSPEVLIPPAVYQEAVVAGLRRGAADAPSIEEARLEGKLSVVTPSASPLPVTALVGLGEEESIRLALDRNADWLLIDDLAARRAAAENLQASKAPTRVKGTLGVIVSVHLRGGLPAASAIALVEALSRRPDIWINSQLCRSVAEAIRAGAER